MSTTSCFFPNTFLLIDEGDILNRGILIWVALPISDDPISHSKMSKFWGTPISHFLFPISCFSLPISHFHLQMGSGNLRVGNGNKLVLFLLQMRSGAWEVGNQKWEMGIQRWEMRIYEWETFLRWEVGNGTQTRIPIFKISPSVFFADETSILFIITLEFRFYYSAPTQDGPKEI